LNITKEHYLIVVHIKTGGLYVNQGSLWDT